MITIKSHILLALLLLPMLTLANTAENQAIIDLLNQENNNSNLELEASANDESTDTDELSKVQSGIGDVYLSVGSFTEERGDRSGVEISAMVNTSSHYAGKISGVIFSGRNKENLMDVFSGFSYTGYLHFNQKHINLNLGIGLFIGETFNCTDEEAEDIDEEDKCYEEIILTAYPEIGVAINLEALHIYPYIRRYNFNDNNTYGVNMGIRF